MSSESASPSKRGYGKKAKNAKKYLGIWDVLPYIDETAAENLKYEYTAEYGEGIIVNGYTGESTQVRIPDMIEEKPVVSVDLRDKRITELVVPDTVQFLRFNNKNLQFANVPRDIKSLCGVRSHGNGGKTCRSFVRAKKLCALYIAEGVAEIGERAFAHCTSLFSVTIPGSVTELKKHTFHGCTGLAYVKFSEGVTTIGRKVFPHCKNLSGVTFPDSVTRMEWDSFPFFNLDWTIKCHSGSYAEKYAIKNNIPYINI